MIKKALPVVFASALALTACNANDGALPDNNETPMQEMERDMKRPVKELERDLTPNERVGPNLDGLDNNRNNGGVMERDRKGIINDNNQELENNRDGLLDNQTMDGELNNPASPNGVIRKEDRQAQ